MCERGVKTVNDPGRGPDQTLLSREIVIRIRISFSPVSSPRMRVWTTLVVFFVTISDVLSSGIWPDGVHEGYCFLNKKYEEQVWYNATKTSDMSNMLPLLLTGSMLFTSLEEDWRCGSMMNDMNKKCLGLPKAENDGRNEVKDVEEFRMHLWHFVRLFHNFKSSLLTEIRKGSEQLRATTSTSKAAQEMPSPTPSPSQQPPPKVPLTSHHSLLSVPVKMQDGYLGTGRDIDAHIQLKNVGDLRFKAYLVLHESIYYEINSIYPEHEGGDEKYVTLLGRLHPEERLQRFYIFDPLQVLPGFILAFQSRSEEILDRMLHVPSLFHFIPFEEPKILKFHNMLAPITTVVDNEPYSFATVRDHWSSKLAQFDADAEQVEKEFLNACIYLFFMELSGKGDLKRLTDRFQMDSEIYAKLAKFEKFPKDDEFVKQIWPIISVPDNDQKFDLDLSKKANDLLLDKVTKCIDQLKPDQRGVIGSLESCIECLRKDISIIADKSNIFEELKKFVSKPNVIPLDIMVNTCVRDDQYVLIANKEWEQDLDVFCSDMLQLMMSQSPEWIDHNIENRCQTFRDFLGGKKPDSVDVIVQNVMDESKMEKLLQAYATNPKITFQEAGKLLQCSIGHVQVLL